ncbi:D-alanine aminotransferase [Planctomycetes bacterium Pan216]|uniref:D-alanine aminotransferase n=1 Tax=Kolteria novifilia TaxID=2527975 RepID=A0A518BC09_9BACT|nr:D-alanine aminotransferase [Planctomycetes bacterium Pan216]
MSSTPLANWNGDEMPLDQVRVSVLDRAFLFGDAVYEAIRVYSGRAWLLGEHLQRLRHSLKEVQIVADVDRLHERLARTLANSDVQEGVIYIQVTRGEAPRRHAFPKEPVTPNELIYIKEVEPSPTAAGEPRPGMRVVTFPDWRWKRCDIKSTNLLANCIAAEHAEVNGCDEAILVHHDGSVSEGSRSSLFAVRAGALLTAPADESILPGITRQLVFRLADRIGLRVIEEAVRHETLTQLDELFLTGTTTEVAGIIDVDGRPIGDGTTGPVTAALQDAHHRAVQEWLATGATIV